MGWFNNSMTPDRANNSIQMVAVAVTMGASKTQLDHVNTFVDMQSRRAQGLVGQAFAIQGASSALGRELQGSINDLGSCLAAGRELSENIDADLTALNFLISQFDTPRLSRSLNMSGRDMAVLATSGAIEVSQRIELLKNRHAGPVFSAVSTVDRADRELNGSRSLRAQDNIPKLD